jgi:dienelactone hydrolase
VEREGRRRRRWNPRAVGALAASVVVLAGCASTTATASQGRASTPRSTVTSTTTTTLGVLPPPQVAGLRITPMYPPPGLVPLPGASWLRVDRPDGAVQFVAVFRPPTPGPHPAVVYLHGSSGLAESELAWAYGLSASGFIVVAGCYLDVDPAVERPTPHHWIPCPGLRKGEPDHPWEAAHWYQALLDVATALPDAEPDGLGVVGISYGAIEALSVHDPRVKVIVADSGYGKAGVGPVTAPVLLLGMTSDPRVKHSNVVGFEWMLHGAGKTVASQYYPGGGHVATLGLSPWIVTDATRRAQDWLHRTLD